MGLFGKSFAEKVEEALQQVRSKGLGVEQLAAEVDGKKVTLRGLAPSMEVKTLVMNEFNALIETENTFNMIRLTTPPAAAVAAPVPTPEQAPTERVHEVVAGDTLGAIAQRYYGKAGLYPKIFEANRDQLDNPDRIKVGQKLRIPD